MPFGKKIAGQQAECYLNCYECNFSQNFIDCLQLIGMIHLHYAQVVLYNFKVDPVQFQVNQHAILNKPVQFLMNPLSNRFYQRSTGEDKQKRAYDKNTKDCYYKVVYISCHDLYAAQSIRYSIIHDCTMLTDVKKELCTGGVIH